MDTGALCRSTCARRRASSHVLPHPLSFSQEAKAARMAAIQVRHDRHGLSADCSLPHFGDPSDCVNHDDDNNGLWTSLLVAANAFR